MNNKSKIHVVSVGMITSVGEDSKKTAAAIKAGISRYQDSQCFNKNFNPIKMSLVDDSALPSLNEELQSLSGLTSRQRRMLRLATPALLEVLDALPINNSIPLFLSGPETLKNCPEAINIKFLEYLVKQTDANIDLNASRLFATGKAGGIQAIDLAFKFFETTDKDVVLVGGIDSFLDNYLLSFLDNENRILAENILDGFVPGEAAGFIMLVSDRIISKLSTKQLATLYLPGLASEKGHRYSSMPYKGDGLSDSFNSAISNGNLQPIESVFSSMNGENFDAKEYGVALMRNTSAFNTNFDHIHPAENFGDIGAAFGPVLIGLMAQYKTKNAICYCSSNTEHRSAINVTQ